MGTNLCSHGISWHEPCNLCARQGDNNELRQEIATLRTQLADSDKAGEIVSGMLEDRDGKILELELERDRLNQQLAARERELEEAKELHKSRLGDRIEMTNDVAAGLERIQSLEKALLAVDSLIGESDGVYGLHLNGDPSPWDELRTGGRYEEWLRDFDAALSPQPEQEKEDG